MGSGFSKKKKQAKMMQEQFMKMQEEMKAVEVTGSASNGLVSITLNGEHELVKIKISPECVDTDDVEALEDLITLAHRDAVEKLKKEQGGSTPGMPPGFGGLEGLLGGL